MHGCKGNFKQNIFYPLLKYKHINEKTKNRPAPIPGCPPGLEYLTMVDHLNVQQMRSLVEGR